MSKYKNYRDVRSDIEYVMRIIDMDEWKHSWHNKLKCYDDLVRAREVLYDKQKEREDDLKKIRPAIDYCEELMEHHKELESYEHGT